MKIAKSKGVEDVGHMQEKLKEMGRELISIRDREVMMKSVRSRECMAKRTTTRKGKLVGNYG